MQDLNFKQAVEHLGKMRYRAPLTFNGANERDTQDLKFKQDVEHAGITWNQFTVFTAHTLLLLAMHKKECYKKFSLVISILTLRSTNNSLSTDSVSKRKTEHSYN